LKVILYSTHCPRCSMVEKKLKDKNIDYVEINDVDKMTELGFASVPMLDVDGVIMDYTKAIKFLMEEM
jgi:glutaredoxin